MSHGINVAERDSSIADVVDNSVDIADQFGQAYTPTDEEINEGPVNEHDFQNSEVIYEAGEQETSPDLSNLLRSIGSGEVNEGPATLQELKNSQVEWITADPIPEYINPTPEELDQATGVIDSLVEAREGEILETAEEVKKKSIFGRLLEKGSLLFGNNEMLDTPEKQTLLGTIQEHTPLFKDCENWKQAYGWWVRNFPKMYGQFIASEVYVAGVVLTFAPHVIPLGRTVVAPMLLHLGYKHSDFIKKLVPQEMHNKVKGYKPKEDKKK